MTFSRGWPPDESQAPRMGEGLAAGTSTVTREHFKEQAGGQCSRPPP